MDLKNELVELLRVTAAIKELEAQQAALREIVRRVALDELETTGAARTWRLKGLGTISLTTYDPKPLITDEDAFAEFVEEHVDPQAVENVKRVRASDVERLCGLWERAAGAGVLVTTDGEVVPGVCLSCRPPALRVLPAKPDA